MGQFRADVKLMSFRRRWQALGLPLQLVLWGWVMVWSTVSGRLDLLLRAIYHPVVGIGGALLMALGLLQCLVVWQGRASDRLLSQPLPRGWWLSVLMAVLVLLLPPEPSFSDLASSRPSSLPEAPQLAFVLPPEQRTLTEWVRLLRTQPDPSLHEGAPLSISGFVFQPAEGPPQLARLMVRCCLADASPSGLPVVWPQDFTPNTDTWLQIKGTMVVVEVNGEVRNAVKPTQITAIPRPARPLEP